MRSCAPVAFALVAGASLAAADIVHVQFPVPIDVPPTGVPCQIDLNADGADDIAFSNDGLTSVRAINGGIAGAFLPAAPFQFEYGELIQAPRYWDDHILPIDNYGAHSDAYDWSDTGAYMGFRIRTGSDFLHGWFLLSSVYDFFNDVGPATLTLYAYAYETTPNTPIRAGAIPAPGSVAAFAVGAIASNRRSRASQRAALRR